VTFVEDINPRGTRHCETSTLGVLLRHQGLDLSEPMLFGLGSGLSFVYWDSRNMDFPFLGGRVKPFELTRNLAANLGLELRVQETTSARTAWANVVTAVDAGRPVGLQLDSYHLDYFTSKVHFGGHVVALYGYDDDRAHLVDTEQQGGAVSTGLDSLAAARAARGPMTARRRSFTVDVPDDAPEPWSRIVPAITACAEAFLHPPIANLGHRGIEKAGRLAPTWFERAADPARDLAQAALLMEKGGTGGALFRNLYRDFLTECAARLDSAPLREGLRLYTEAAAGWTHVAELMADAGRTGEERRLTEAGELLRELSGLERRAMEQLVRLG
jgi:hypothetical protein